MVTKAGKQGTGRKKEKKGQVTVENLKLRKETVKDLTRNEKRQIQGGRRRLSEVSCDAGCE
jgi:hypothetical protein